MIKYTFKHFSENKFETVVINDVLKFKKYNHSVFITISENSFLEFNDFGNDESFLDISGKVYTKDEIMENPERVFAAMQNDILKTKLEALP